jgi:hypothetical protein
VTHCKPVIALTRRARAEEIADAESFTTTLSREVEALDFALLILRVEDDKIIAFTCDWDKIRRRRRPAGEGVFSSLALAAESVGTGTGFFLDETLIFHLAHVALLEAPLASEERDEIDVGINLLEQECSSTSAIAKERRSWNGAGR